jgi:phosphohistidine phosphatase
MRHAKTEMQQLNQKDFDRVLIERGIKDAMTMGARLSQRGIKPELIISSSAKRTEQTASIIAQELEYKHKIQKEDRLYLSNASTIEGFVIGIPDSIHCAMLIGHNPGVSQFVYETNSRAISDEMPTSALVVFGFEARSWQDFLTIEKQVEIYDYPKI